MANVVRSNFDLNNDGKVDINTIAKSETNIAGVQIGNLTNYFTFEETSGTRNDSVGSITLAEVGGTVTSEAGISGNAARFTGSGSAVLQDATQTSPVGDFSIAFWLYPIVANTSNNIPIAQGNIGTGVSWYIQLDNISGTTDVTWIVTNDGSSAINTAGFELTLNTWHLIVASYNTTTGETRLNVDNGVTVTNTAGTGGLFSSNIFTVGAISLSGSPNLITNSRIDELAIYDGYILTDSDITDLYNSGAGTFYANQVGGTFTSSNVFEVNEETLSATKSLLVTDKYAQILNPDAVARDVVLPSNPFSGLHFLIINDSDGLSASGNTLNIKETAAGPIIQVLDDTSGLLSINVIYTGSKWVFWS